MNTIQELQNNANLEYYLKFQATLIAMRFKISSDIKAILIWMLSEISNSKIGSNYSVDTVQHFKRF